MYSIGYGIRTLYEGWNREDHLDARHNELTDYLIDSSARKGIEIAKKKNELTS
jgi:hypothetical protein